MNEEERLWKINKLICGDNLEELAKLPKESVDLIYIDPPFFTHKQYEVVWGDEAEVRSYKDRWGGGIEHFIGWLKPRVKAMYEVLKLTGSFYIHCDWHANAHIRIMLDEIFGGENFKNEIIWSYGAGGNPDIFFPRKHDTIYFYTKSGSNYFDTSDKTMRVPFGESTLKTHFKHIDKDGRKYRIQEKNGKKYITYEDEGKLITDVWTDIGGQNATSPISPEYTGYPTQKPEALLERIIKSTTREQDIVLDAFAGSGTTIAVAQKLGRRWIGVDISPTAIKIMQRRLEGRLGMIEGVNYEVIGMPTNVEDVRKLEPFEFQNWVVIDKMRANASRKKVGDMGLDGYYPRSVLTEEAGIQVKQSDNIERNVVDNFETALKRANYKKGYIIAFSFTTGAYEEVARIKNKGELDIKLITVKELLTNYFPLKNEK